MRIPYTLVGKVGGNWDRYKLFYVKNDKTMLIMCQHIPKQYRYQHLAKQQIVDDLQAKQHKEQK